MMEFFFHVLGASAAGVAFSSILVAPGMLLAPVQAWLRNKYRLRTGNELDEQAWWQPIWGCYKCVTTWFGLVTYLYHYHAPYSWWAHIYFTSLVLLTAILLNGLYAWSQKQ